MHGQPARPQCRHQRRRLGVEEQADEHHGEHHRREHEQPDVPQPGRPEGQHHVRDDGDSTVAVANSYMLPHGSRSVASPRVSRTAACDSAPSPVRAAPPDPTGGPAAYRPAAPLRAPPPAATSTGQRPKASWAQNATTASPVQRHADREQRVRQRGERRVRSHAGEPPVPARGRAAVPAARTPARSSGQGRERGPFSPLPRVSEASVSTVPPSPGRAATRANTRSRRSRASRAGRQQGDGRREHPALAGVVGVLQGGELAETGEGDRRAVVQGQRLPHRQVRRARLGEPAAVDLRRVEE